MKKATLSTDKEHTTISTITMGPKEYSDELDTFEKNLRLVNPPELRAELRGGIVAILELLRRSDLYKITLGETQARLENLEGIVGAVASRSAIDIIFKDKIKAHLPAKIPEKKYTLSQIEQGCINFLKTNDSFGVALKTLYQGLNVEELAKKIRLLYGRLSKLDHALFNSLAHIFTPKAIVNFIQKMPAVLMTSEEIEFSEKMIRTYIETKESEKENNLEDEDEEK